MKRSIHAAVLTASSLLLSGCTALEPYLLAGGVASAGIMTYSLVTGRCMNGQCPWTEEYKNSTYPNAYADWVKAETSIEQRRKDALECGGRHDRSVPDRLVFSIEQAKAEMLPADGPDLFFAKDRLTSRWAACMQSKGYTPQSGPFYRKP
jgi:hypothetical protein